MRRLTLVLLSSLPLLLQAAPGTAQASEPDGSPRLIGNRDGFSLVWFDDASCPLEGPGRCLGGRALRAQLDGSLMGSPDDEGRLQLALWLDEGPDLSVSATVRPLHDGVAALEYRVEREGVVVDHYRWSEPLDGLDYRPLLPSLARYLGVAVEHALDQSGVTPQLAASVGGELRDLPAALTRPAGPAGGLALGLDRLFPLQPAYLPEGEPPAQP